MGALPRGHGAGAGPAGARGRGGAARGRGQPRPVVGALPPPRLTEGARARELALGLGLEPPLAPPPPRALPALPRPLPPSPPAAAPSGVMRRP